MNTLNLFDQVQAKTFTKKDLMLYKKGTLILDRSITCLSENFCQTFTQTELQRAPNSISKILAKSGGSEGTSSVAFEELKINCQRRFKHFFNFNCLTSNFCFPKRYIFRRQRNTRVMDASPYVRSLNSTGKMMTCSNLN